MGRVLGVLFGAKSQVCVGVLCFLVGVCAWLYWSFVTPPTVTSVFQISMFYGQVACYAIVATGLGYRATERVEAHVADVAQADKVEINPAGSD